MNRILVIDDDAGNRLIVKSRLSDLGYEVITTETGASGLMEVRSAPLDLVLVATSIDTGISSIEICRRLKAMPESSQVPVVLYSNQAPNPDEMSRAFEAGCDGFVNKTEMSVLDQEHLRILLLNTRNEVLGIQEIYVGNVNSSVVRAAEVFRPAVQANAPSIIVVHNHPSGYPAPSFQDVDITNELISAGKFLGIELLDHVVLGSGNRFVSMNERRSAFT